MIEKELKERISLEEQLKVGQGSMCFDAGFDFQTVDMCFLISVVVFFFKEANTMSPFGKFRGFVFRCRRCLIGCKTSKFSHRALYPSVCLSQGVRGRETFRAAVTWHGIAVSSAMSQDDPTCINSGWGVFAAVRQDAKFLRIHKTSRSSRIVTLEYFWPCRPVGYTKFW